MVKVTQEVYDGLEAVRSAGPVNMFDRNGVMHYLNALDFSEAVVWVYENPKTYRRLIFEGPEIADVADTDQ